MNGIQAVVFVIIYNCLRRCLGVEFQNFLQSESRKRPCNVLCRQLVTRLGLVKQGRKVRHKIIGQSLSKNFELIVRHESNSTTVPIISSQGPADGKNLSKIAFLGKLGFYLSNQIPSLLVHFVLGFKKRQPFVFALRF